MVVDRAQQSPGMALLERVTLADVEAVRLLLAGNSVIDWHRLAFTDYEQVDRFLRVNEFDPDNIDDLNRLEELREEAIEYLTRSFSYRIPDEISDGMPVRDLLLLASRPSARKNNYACIILKAMHVIHHLAGRELLFTLPISDNELFGYVEKKVVRVVEEIRSAGYPIVEFAWSRKERDSLITKLLAKRASIAANVYDKLRFRLITRRSEDLAPVLFELTHRLVPFNYIIPGESVNGILPFRKLVEETPPLKRFSTELQHDIDEEKKTAGGNEFSGPGYRIINFVADLPVRIDPYLDDERRLTYGSVVFVLAEFQVLDAATALQNETGENSHNAYKERQVQRVRARLSGGPGRGKSATMPVASDEDPDDDE